MRIATYKREKDINMRGMKGGGGERRAGMIRDDIE
jgi:hypothetical protein